MTSGPLPTPPKLVGWSIYNKLAATFLFILVLVLLGDFLIWIFFWNKQDDYGRQFVYRNLADRIEEQLHPLLIQPYDQQRLTDAIFKLSELNRDIDISVIDEEGKILVRGQPADRWKIDIGPVKKFLEQQGADLVPIYGDHPGHHARAFNAQAVFSAAKIRPGAVPGYIYIVLSSARSSTILGILGDYYLLFVPACLVLYTFAFCGVIGLVIFRHITRRILTLAGAVKGFARGDMSVRAPSQGKDEIDLLALTFNSMAETIQQNVSALEQNDRARRSFTAYVSHDLRGPLTSIRGFLQRARTETRPEKQAEYLGIIDRNAAQLDSMIQDLFELSKLELRNRTIKRELFPIVELADETISRFRVAAEGRGVTLAVELEGGIQDPLVEADPVLIGRVLLNLVDNALRYTPSGGRITITVRSSGPKRVGISVSDTGKGIAATHIPRVFEQFYQAESDEPRGDGGSGIGLAIVKHVIDAHDSSISVSSIEGEGTVFTFDLPCCTGRE